MSTSLLHLSLAACAGLAFGAVGATSLLSSGSAARPAPPPPATTTNREGALGEAAGPPKVYHGSLTGRDVAGEVGKGLVLDPRDIGESASGRGEGEGGRGQQGYCVFRAERALQ